MSEKPAKAIEVFFSYSHKDEELRDELEKHLSILKRQGVIQSWHDRRIGAGREWEGEIDTHLNTADVILLLISSDFLASDYCYDVEMKRAMERHEAGEARVIPVILRPVDWKDAPFGKLQALPTDARPVTSWPDRDEAFLDVARGIRVEVEELASFSAGPSSFTGTAIGRPKKGASTELEAPIHLLREGEEEKHATTEQQLSELKKQLYKLIERKTQLGLDTPPDLIRKIKSLKQDIQSLEEQK